MCFRFRCIALFLLLLLSSCSLHRKMQRICSGEIGVAMAVSEELDDEGEEEDAGACDAVDCVQDGPVLMNAVRDEETGDMVAADVLCASKVVARFRNVAERGGFVTIGFDVHVPSGMADSRWRLKLYPLLHVRQDTLRLEPVFVTGHRYREQQIRGYQRYKDFIASIITDTTDLLRVEQLEIFLKRNFPETYAMKTDSSVVSDDVAEGLFGVTQAETVRHYTRHLKKYFNDRKKRRIGKVYDRYVRDPIVSEGVRLDTVLASSEGDFIYKYLHTFRSRPRLKKVWLTIDGAIYEDGALLGTLPYSDSLTFYISTLSSMADTLPRYKLDIAESVAYERLRADISFERGNSVVDTLLSDNASELRRVLNCIDDIVSQKEYALDSLVIVASCSPEGRYAVNHRLAAARADAVKAFIGTCMPEELRGCLKSSCIPEDWDRLMELVEADTCLPQVSKTAILDVAKLPDAADIVERRLSRLPEYGFLQHRIYPELRSVTFDFHMHRVEMSRDTVQTSVLDTLYMTGLRALQEMDYKKAAAILGPYGDYNAALAFIAADMNFSAMKILEGLDDRKALICYLKSMVLSRMGRHDEASRYFKQSVSYDPLLEYRANLDPEMHLIVNKTSTLKN